MNTDKYVSFDRQAFNDYLKTIDNQNDLSQIIVDNMSGYLHIGFMRKDNYHSYFIKPSSWKRLKLFLKNMTFEKCHHFSRFYIHN